MEVDGVIFVGHEAEILDQPRKTVPGDAALIVRFISALAAYEKLSHEAKATEADINDEAISYPYTIIKINSKKPITIK